MAPRRGRGRAPPGSRRELTLDATGAAEPSRIVASRDGTSIAVFTSGTGPPLVLVHGAAADHTTFRVVGPLLARDFTVHAVDRRGRGASGDHEPYSIEREFEDLAAVAEAVGGGAPGVAVFGHSFGGRCALGAALRTEAIDRVVVYEGAPSPPGATYRPAGIEDRLRACLEAGDRDGLLAAFLAEVVGMSAADLAAYRADPIWPRRAAAAHTILRELDAEASPAAGLDALSAVRIPVLQLLGGSSPAIFGIATRALDERLPDGRVVVLPGQKHAAHHTDPDRVVAEVRAFLMERRVGPPG